MVVRKAPAWLVLTAVALILAAIALVLAVPGKPAAAQPAPDTVDHWGSFTGSPRGDNLLVPSSISLPGQIAEVGTSNSTQYALLTNGTLYAWGEGAHGQLGDGSRASLATAAVQVRFPPGVRIASIPTDTMPYDSALAIDSKGNAWGWGYNNAGELCTGNHHSYTSPVELPFTDVTALAGGGSHAVYDADGTVYSCGSGQAGDLGDGTKDSSSHPVQVWGLDGRSVTTLVAAYANAGALLSNGEYYDWGLDSEGQLGIGTVGQDSLVPVRVPLSAPVQQVAEGGSLTGNGQTLVMLSDGSLWAWGDDHFYQLGNGTGGVRPSPVRFSAPGGATYATLATAGDTSYAVSTNGQVYAWGQGNKGQIGDGRLSKVINPVVVDSGAASISATANDVAVSASQR